MKWQSAVILAGFVVAVTVYVRAVIPFLIQVAYESSTRNEQKRRADLELLYGKKAARRWF